MAEKKKQVLILASKENQNMYQNSFKYPKFCLKAQVASSAKFWKCTLPFVLIGGKFRPVSKTTNCLLKIACFWHQYVPHPYITWGGFQKGVIYCHGNYNWVICIQGIEPIQGDGIKEGLINETVGHLTKQLHTE